MGALQWVESLKERFQYSNLIDSVGILAAKEVLLLVLSGNAVQQSRKLSGCTLSDVLESGAFYMRCATTHLPKPNHHLLFPCIAVLSSSSSHVFTSPTVVVLN